MARTRKKALYVVAEATFGTDPDADGSDYLPIPAQDLSDLKDDLELIETNYFTGRARSTTPIVGRDGASFTFKVPFQGYGTAAGNGAAPAAVDYLDTMLLHIFGSASTNNGVTVTATSSSSITGGTDVFNIGDVTMVYEAGYPSAVAQRSHAQLVTTNTSPWTVIPGFADAGPDAGSVAFGSRSYRLDDDGGATLAFVYVEDDVQYTLLGCRVSSFKATAEAGQPIMLEFDVRCSTKAITTKASLVATLLTTPVAVPLLVMSPVWFGTTNMGHVGKITLDWALETAVLDSTNGDAAGRGGDESIQAMPTITIDPPADSTRSHFTLKRTAAVDEVMVQFGRGQLSGGAINSGLVCFPAATARTVDIQDENGRLRNSVEFKADDAGATFAQAIFARF
jgi:hypothetical protein